MFKKKGQRHNEKVKEFVLITFRRKKRKIKTISETGIKFTP